MSTTILMSSTVAPTGLQLRSLVKSSGELELSLVEIPTPAPADNEIVVRVEAAPINPSDLATLVSAADLAAATSTGSGASTVVTAPIPKGVLRALGARLDKSLPIGNEGAGTVVAAGSSPAAQALIGKTVALLGGAMYSQYRIDKAANVLVLGDGVTAAQGASAFVNPLTALGFVETMKREGHKSLINTAAASNLGQMLVKLCQVDKIDLINIVRSEEQGQILRDLGAVHICDSSSPDFMKDLVAAIVATGATIAFDAIGGGKLVGQILTAMEIAQNQTAKVYSPYGSTTHKQVYIYGGLDLGPTEFSRNFGLFWGIGGWLVTPFLMKIGFEASQKLRERAAAELTTIFASQYTSEISLSDCLNLETLRSYAQKSTGKKYLINPSKG